MVDTKTYELAKGALRVADSGAVAVLTTQYDAAGDVGDVLVSVDLPADATVVDVIIDVSAELDSNASPTLAFNVGSSANDDELVAISLAGSALGAGGRESSTGTVTHVHAVTPVTYKTAATVNLTVDAQAATAVAGNIRLIILYYGGFF